MEEEIQQIKSKKDYKIHLAVFLTFFLTSLIVGGLAFFSGFKENTGLEKQVNILKDEIAKLTQEKNILNDEAFNLNSQIEQCRQSVKYDDTNFSNIDCNFSAGCDLYESDNFGIKFYYRKGGIIEEDENKIKLLLPASNKYLASCDQEPSCKIIEGMPYIYEAGTIELFNKEQEETIQNAIFDMIKKEGVQIDNCTIKEISKEDNKVAMYVVNSRIAIEADKKFEGENWMYTSGSRQQKLNELCSTYANGDINESLFSFRYFLYNRNDIGNYFIFLPGTGQDAPFYIPSSIEFIE